jgi:RES domain-containing protein
VGGRCNYPGVAAVYASAHVLLAVLEILVHLDKTEIPADYLLMGIDLSSAVVEDATPDAARELSLSRISPVIRVKSIVVPRETNYILYPEVPGFAPLIAFSESFGFDARLFPSNRTFAVGHI